MRKVLIVSPHFAPVNAPDMHRVRLALPWLREHGWEPVVLGLAPDSIEHPVCEPLLEHTYPSDIRVVRARGIPPSVTRALGFGGLWIRCGGSLRRAGERLLRTERFDLVFFSTTQFDAFRLGPRWRRQFGIPYILDYQDPWGNDHYARTGTPPPGGRLRFALAYLRAKRHEPGVLAQASGVIAVSEDYSLELGRRYPWFNPATVVCLPFGFSSHDFDIARRNPPRHPLLRRSGDAIQIVYTGRGGSDMAAALTVLFRALRRFRETAPTEAAPLHFSFIGTSYAPPPLGCETIIPIARAEGVADAVSEYCDRVPYFEAIHYQLAADALLVLGSSDQTYHASKLQPLFALPQPLLMIFRAGTQALRLAHEQGVETAFGFDPTTSLDSAADQVLARWFQSGAYRIQRERRPGYPGLTAERMTAQLTACFDKARI